MLAGTDGLPPILLVRDACLETDAFAMVPDGDTAPQHQLGFSWTGNGKKVCAKFGRGSHAGFRNGWSGRCEDVGWMGGLCVLRGWLQEDPRGDRGDRSS